MTPEYANGYVPERLLVIFRRGSNARDGDWYHGFPPATYARHLALIRRAFNRTGRTLALNYGWTAYRPLWAQRMLKAYYTSIGQPQMAATEGTSSHGGRWEGRQTMAGDYSNWAWVYEHHGGRAAFYADCRAVGLLPGMIHPSRNRTYPDEPWHVIDPDPWGAVPVFDGVVLPFNPQAPSEEDDMFSDDDRALLKEVQKRLRGEDPNADMLQRIQVDTHDTQLRVRGGDANVDMLQAILMRVGGADIDEAQLAADLAPYLAQNLGTLSDETIAALATASADEQDRRDRERLGGG